MTCSFSSDSEMKWTYQKHETNSCTRHKAREVKSLLLIGLASDSCKSLLSDAEWQTYVFNNYSTRTKLCRGHFSRQKANIPAIYWKHNRTRVVFRDKAFEKQWFAKTAERILNAFEYVVLVHVCFTFGVFFLLCRISLYPSSHGCWPAGKWDD